MESLSKSVRVAVVILNWNGVQHLRQFLPSVVENTPAWVDVVVADNGSNDESCDLLRESFSQRVQILELGDNWGFAEGYNRALASIDHDIFILLNSDVEVTPGWIEPLLREFESADNIAVVGSKILSYNNRTHFEYAGASGGYIDILGYPFCRGRVLSSCEEDRGQYDDARDLFWVSGAAFGVRASIFHHVGGFDGDLFAHMEEIDLCWRLQLAGYRIRIAPQSVVYHLGGGTLSAESPHKVMLNHRNNLAMLYKCSSMPQRIVVAIVRPLLDIIAAVSYLLLGRLSAAIAVGTAWWEFLSWHKSLSGKRRKIRGGMVAEARYIYRGSILLRYLLGRDKSPLV